MKPIKITNGNVTKRINTGAKNFEDLMNISKKIFQLREKDLFKLIYTENSEEKILENDEEYQNLLKKTEDNKPLKFRLEEDENNFILNNTDFNFGDELKNNLNALPNSFHPYFNGDVYCQDELLFHIENILQEKLKEVSQTIISEIEKNKTNNFITSEKDNYIYSNEKCINCQNNITLIKYECIICNNLILCENCKNIHGNHPLIMFNLSSNEIKNKKNIEEYYKNKYEKEKNEELNKQMEEKKNEKREFKFSIKQNHPQIVNDGNTIYCYVILTVKNESNYDFENDNLSFVAIYKNDENLVICQNNKIKQLKSHEKKDILVEFFIANKSLEKLEIKLILQNKNSDNIIQSNEINYSLPIPKPIQNKNDKLIPKDNQENDDYRLLNQNNINPENIGLVNNIPNQNHHGFIVNSFPFPGHLRNIKNNFTNQYYPRIFPFNFFPPIKKRNNNQKKKKI
jgi:hypothetical protein